MNDRDLLRQLDVCRPGSSDIETLESDAVAERLAADPQARQMRERLERIDRLMIDAFLDVQPPAGLQERLLGRLSETASARGFVGTSCEIPSGAPQDDPTATLAARDETDVLGDPRPEARGQSRRRWLAAAGVALAASVAVMVTLSLSGDAAHLTMAQVQEEAIRQYADNPAGAARPLDADPALVQHPFSQQLVQVRNRPTWQPVTNFLGISGVAYDVVGAGDARARLYVLQCKIDELPTRPYPHATVETGGLWSTAWREGDLAYVLVVPVAGIADPARRFFGSPSPVL